MIPKNKTAIMIFFLLIAACPVSAHTDHAFCVLNNTGETIEVCLYPKDPLYSDNVNACFWIKDNGHCEQRNIYFENKCGYDLCMYGAASGENYGCIRNMSCESVGYTVDYGGSPYVCGNSYCKDDVEDDSHTVVYCFISASSFR